MRLLSLEGCSLLTTHCLESIISSWSNSLESLKVKSCNNIKDGEIKPEVSGVFSFLKNLKWEPDTRNLLSANLAQTGIGKRGEKFFNKSYDWKSLPGS